MKLRTEDNLAPHERLAVDIVVRAVEDAKRGDLDARNWLLHSRQCHFYCESMNMMQAWQMMQEWVRGGCPIDGDMIPMMRRYI